MALDIAFASATRLAAMIRSRKIGCVELLDHYLKRVERYNPRLNAIIATDIPAAQKRARDADRALARRKEGLGPFHGIPITIKEAFDVAGMATTWGLPDYRDNIAGSNAVAVDRWQTAGAVLFGKTNVPTWVADGQTFNQLYGSTNNPWDITRTPGGSSGGAAAAVAAGLTGIETGSDIASSIRNPASFCGIYGHKPSYGICPPRGHSLKPQVYPDDINAIGPLARSAADLDAALTVLAGPEEIDAVGYKLTLPAPKKQMLRDFKVGIVLNEPPAEMDDEVRDLLQQLADFLARQKVKISDRARPAVDAGRTAQIFGLLLRAATSHRQTDEVFARNVEAARALDPADDTHPARMLRANTMAHRDWLALNEERHRLRWVWHEFFKDYDLLLCPAFGIPAHPHMQDTLPYQRQVKINGVDVPYINQVFWAGYSGVVYLPGTVAPIGLTRQGLPVGVQIIGPQYGDRTCIHFAKLLEKEYRGFVPPPGYE